MTNIGKQNIVNLSHRRIVTLFFSRLFPILVLTAITVLYSRSLGLEDYGHFQTVLMYASALSVVFAFGFPPFVLSQPPGSLTQLWQQYRKPILVVYITLIAAAILLLAYTKLPLLLKALCIVISVTQALSLVLESVMIKTEQELALVYISASYSSLFLAWHFILLFTSLNLSTLFLGIVLLQCMRVVVMRIILKRRSKVETMNAVTPALQQWLYLGWNEGLNVSARWLDKLVLVYFISAVDFALFFNGTYEVPFSGLLVSVAGSLITVQCAATESKQERLRLFQSGFLLLSTFIFPLFAFLVFFGADCFRLLFGTAYAPALPLFYVSILLLPLRINSYTPVLQTAGKGNIILKGSVIDLLLTLVLVIVLYTTAGLTGAAFAAVLATYVQAGYYLFHSAKALQVKLAALIPVRILLIRLVIALCLFGMVYLLVQNSSWQFRIMFSAVVLIVTIAAGFWVAVGQNKKRPHSQLL